MNAGFVVNPAGHTVVVSATLLPTGASVQLYLDEACTVEVSSPSVKSPTTFYVATSAGEYPGVYAFAVSLKIGSVETATSKGQPRVISLGSGSNGTVGPLQTLSPQIEITYTVAAPA